MVKKSKESAATETGMAKEEESKKSEERVAEIELAETLRDGAEFDAHHPIPADREV